MAEPVTFSQYTLDALSPTVFQGEFGQRFLAGTLGIFFDLLAESANQAVKARFIDSDTCPSDALDLIGAGRLMPRYPIDTDETYRARLRNGWAAWRQAGTAQAIIGQLAALGLQAEVKEPFTPGWNWDGAANWSRFWVVITAHPWSSWQWGDGHQWGAPGLTWGSTATVDEVRSVRAIVRQWKPAHTVCANIIVVMDAGAWAAQQPDGTWHDPARRSRAAIYWRG